MTPRLKRRAIAAALCLLAAAAVVPLVPLEFLRPGIARVLERGLGRPVEIEAVYLSLYAGPGFSLSGVTIQEDPRAGIEPFVYAGAVDARLDLPGLLQGRRGFSNLRFADATMNLVKPDREAWNFQMLMSGAPAAISMPSIQIRGGRVNLKSGEMKSVFYLDDTDIDVQTASTGKTVEFRVSGIPMRTDRPRQSSGHFFVRGTAASSPAGWVLSMDADLEPSPLESVARLADAGSSPLQGAISGRAHLSGPPSALVVEGTARVDDSRRTELLATAFHGTWDLTSQHLDLATTRERPWTLQAKSEEISGTPHWEVSLDFQDAALDPILTGLRRLAVPVPEAIGAQGSLHGSVSFRSGRGLTGEVEGRDIVVSLPQAGEVHVAALPLRFSESRVVLRPVFVMSKAAASLMQIEALYSAAGRAALELKIAARGLPLADAALLGFAGAPLVDGAQRGTIHGTLQYRGDAWAGEYEVRDAELALEGLAEPLQLESAAVSANHERVAISRIQASIGGVGVTGDYRWDLDPRNAHRFRVHLQGIAVADTERLLLPVLSRDPGFLARTLRLSEKAVPDWFADRKIEGAISISAIEGAGHRFRVDVPRVRWNGTSIMLGGLQAIAEEGSVLTGDLSIDLSGRVPKYRFEGGVSVARYKGGDISLKGTAETTGIGAAALSNLRAEGAFSGRSIAFSKDAVFRSAGGRFVLTVASGGLSWNLSELTLAKGADVYSGEGATQADGLITLDLTANEKRVRHTESVTP